jgi:hypothetical protein
VPLGLGPVGRRLRRVAKRAWASEVRDRSAALSASARSRRLMHGVPAESSCQPVSQASRPKARRIKFIRLLVASFRPFQRIRRYLGQKIFAFSKLRRLEAWGHNALATSLKPLAGLAIAADISSCAPYRSIPQSRRPQVRTVGGIVHCVVTPVRLPERRTLP